MTDKDGKTVEIDRGESRDMPRPGGDERPGKPSEDQIPGAGPTESRRMPGLDGLRGFAVLLVYLNHFCPASSPSPTWNRLVRRGGFGVEIFFVLSGFLITSLLLREERDRGRISIPLFYLRRALRILPPLLAFLGFLAIARMLNEVNFLTIDLFAGFFFFRNYVGNSPETGHLWTLAIEEQFYILWPIFLALMPRGRPRIALIGALVGLSPLWRQLAYHRAGGAGFVNVWRTDLRMEPLLIGALLATLLADPIAGKILRGRVARGFWPVAAGSATLSLALMTDTLDIPILRSVLWTVTWASVAVVINGSVGGRVVGLSAFLHSKPLVWIGTLSYSLYLWQQPFAPEIPLTRPAWFREFPANLILAWSLAVGSYYLLERPLLGLRGRMRRVAEDPIGRLAGLEDSTQPIPSRS